MLEMCEEHVCWFLDILLLWSDNYNVIHSQQLFLSFGSNGCIIVGTMMAGDTSATVQKSLGCHSAQLRLWFAIACDLK